MKMDDRENTNQDASAQKKTVFTKLNTALDKIEVFILVTSVLVVTVAWIVNTIFRELNMSFFFVEEVSTIMVIAMTMFGASYGVRRARHVRMSAVFDALPLRPKKVMIILMSAAGALIMLIMTYHSFDYMAVARAREQLTPALRIPYWMIWTILPVGFFLMFVGYIRTIIKNFKEEDVWLSPEQKTEEE